MKKLISLALAVTMLCLAVCPAMADDGKGGFLDSVGSLFSDAWNSAGEWLSGAWSSASEWISGAWGDASQWVEKAWNESSTWVTDIWGEASDWMTETYSGASAWWTQTFTDVTGNVRNAWSWLQSNASALKTQASGLMADVRSAVAATGNTAPEKVRAAMTEILSKLGVSREDANRIWETLTAYAEEKGLSALAVGKLALPYLLKLCVDGLSQSGGTIPAVAIAQYLTGVIEKLGITTDTSANELVTQLMTVLAGN